jgi:DNA-binding winged helix-turn-helix (wHTH) protein/tetratricopeptide (TPR) repeat protein
LIYRFEEFELDSGRFVLKRRGEPLKVEPKALELLVLLLEHRDRMLGKEELFAALWGKQFYSDSVLPRCVHHARQALGDTSASPRFIKTVHRRGYRFSGEVVVDVEDTVAAQPVARTTPAVAPTPPESSRSKRAIRRPGRVALGLAAAAVLVLVVWEQGIARREAPPDDQIPEAPAPPRPLIGASATAEPLAELVSEQLRARNEDATYQFFTNMGLQRRLTESCGDTGRTVRVIEDAIAADPQFAAGWLGLGVATYAQVWACGLGGEQTQNALEAFDRAMILAPERSEAAMAKVTILTTLGDADAAFELCRRFLALQPRNPNVLYNTQYVLRYAGFLRQSAALLEELVDADPGYLSTFTSGVSPAAYLYLTEWDRFLALLPDNGDSYSCYLRGLAERLRGRPEAARGWLESSVRAGQSSVFGRLAQALLAAMDGRHAEAERLVGEIALQRRSRGAADGEITYKQAEVLALAGRTEAAAKELRRAVEEGFFCARCFELDPAFASMRDDQEYLEALALARERHTAFASRFALPPEVEAAPVPPPPQQP